MNILVDGAPGMGKTTFVRKICKDWQEGKMLNEFKLVVLLTLRDDTIANSHTLQDLLCHDDESLQNSVVKEIKELSGEGLLLLYDGWDELRSDQKQKDCLLCKIILGKVLPKCSVLVTSRPHASAWLWQLGCISRHIEICGFTEKQIKDCFRKALLESPDESAAREMEIYHDMLALCYLPLNLAIALYVYKTRNYSFPSTLTEVYELFTLHALIRHFQAHSPNEVVYLPSIKHLPQPESELYSALCRVAFDGLINKQITFSKEELQAYHPLFPHEHNTLGLMTAFHSFTQVGLSTKYQFTHLTIQEFLAGEKLAGESADFQVDFLSRYISEPQFRMVCIFFSGKAKIEAKVQELFKFFYEYEFHNRWCRNPDRIMLLTHMMNECQNPEILQNVIGGIPKHSLDLSYYPIEKANDCYIVGNFLKKSAIKWKTFDLAYAFSGLHSFSVADSLLQILTEVLRDAHHLSFEEVNLIHNHFSDSALQQFLAIPPLVNLKSVKLDISRKSESATKVLKVLSSLRHLTHLSIVVWKASHFLEVLNTAINDLPLLLSLKVGAYAKRLTVATSDAHYVIINHLMFKLEVFHLECIELTAPFIENLSQCILARCTIRELELSNTLSTSDACTFFQSMQSNTSIQILKLSGINVCDHDRAGQLRIVDAFRGVLLANKILKSVRLGECSYRIASRILRQVLQESAESSKLTNMEMNVYFVPCRKGLICFTEALCNTTIHDYSWKDTPNPFTGNSIKLDPRNKTVQRIYLHIHGDDPVTLKCITCLLSNAVNLKDLVLGTFSGHDIPPSGMLKILKQMQRNTTVESYRYHYDHLPNTDSELKTLVETNTTLKRLALYGLNDLILHGIVERLTRHPSLTAIALGCSHFTLAALQHLFQLFQDNTTVEELELYKAKLHIQGTKSLAQMLEHNQTLKNLKISSCQFGDDRRTAIEVLVHGLHTNTSLTELSMSKVDRDQILSKIYRINFIRRQANLPFLHLYWETVNTL